MREVIRGYAPAVMQPPARLGRGRSQARKNAEGGILRKDVYIVARKKVASEPVLRDWTAVDAALRDLKECQYALTELGVELDRRIDGLKDDYNKNAQPLQNRIKRLEGDVKEYVDAHRAELDGKSRTLVFGKVGYRASSKLMLAPAKVAEAIAALKALGRKELVKTTETLDREALKKEPPALLERIGAFIRWRGVFYYDISGEQPEVQ